MTKIFSNPVYEIGLAYQKTAALKAATKLDVFAVLGRGSLNAEAIAAATCASVRGIRILCDFLTIMGLLIKEESTYRLTSVAIQFLDRSSPNQAAEAIDFFAAPEMVAMVMDDPVSYVRNGGSLDLATVSPNDPLWVVFARSMMPFASVASKQVAAYVAARGDRPRTILDIAAGHGLYGIEIARREKEAVVTAVDWEQVLLVARANAEASGVQGRYRTVAGSAFDVAFQGSFDLVLLANILHHYSHDDCVKLLRKTRMALSPSGYALVIDFVPNPDRVSPPEPASFAFWMLATTPGGDAYTLADYQAMGRDAGFASAAGRPFPLTGLTLIHFENQAPSS